LVRSAGHRPVSHASDYPPWLRVGVLQAATKLASWRREPERALAFSRQALAILPQIDDPNFVCDVMMTDATLASQRRNLDHAEAAMEDVVRYARDHNLPDLSAALVNLGDLAIEQGKLDDGRSLLEEGVACSEDPTSRAALVALINLS
jgi:MalT-like TPR region